jgi:hypothetical protein
LRHALPVSQIALYKRGIWQLWKCIPAVQAIAADNSPILGVQKLNQVGPDESFSSRDERDLLSHSDVPGFRLDLKINDRPRLGTSTL